MPGIDNPEVLLAVIESLAVGVSLVDPQGKIVLWNRHAERLTGFHRQEVIGRSAREGFLACVDLENNELAGDAAPAIKTMRDGKAIQVDVSLQHKSGHRVPLRLRAAVIRDEHGKNLGAVESFEETISVADRERRQSKLAAYGCLDPPSGVLNHSMMQSHLREQLIKFAQYPVPCAVLCVALDQMEAVRTSRGPGALASVVRIVGQTVEITLRPTDAVGRWQENEFLAILQECTAEEARRAAERLRKMAAMAKIEWWGELMPISLSVGVTDVRAVDTTESLMERAESMLRECRRLGGDRVIVDKVSERVE